MEENVVEAITNNILGTKNVVEAATACAAQTFVLISTDKAVRPTSVMGCSKRVAEQVVRAAAQVTGRNFLSVRFGNVLGSRGSVIPTFLKQIEAGGPVTVTHPDMRRFFMTIPEAVEPTAHPKVLRSPADPVSLATGDLIETLIQSALSEPDDWDALRLQLRALVPDFHVPPPPPPADEAEHRAAVVAAERKLKLA